ncbi:MAG: HAMP domain-containing sensor histidine kinase [Reichenbachiella sp.]|uniref:sensor histidine kinase n=1 Tax=Reichenbachiella sp. TaxID=2184521 RepID=UPI003264B916
MKMKALSIREKYTIGGILFGLSFPLFSQFLDCLLNDLSFTWTSIAIIHQRNVIHYVVDTAPVVLGVAGFMLGVSHQKKNDSNRQLREINESLDALTYKITHDLLGPALNVKALTEILHQSKNNLPEDKQAEILSKVHESINNWLLTFEDFMSLLRHEKSGALEQNNCELSDIIAELEEALSLEIEQSGAKIYSDFSESPTVYASAGYLISIFKNLLTNAIKYAHSERKPVIHITSVRHENMVRITFQDNGSGIDLTVNGNKLFMLFERFESSSGKPGSGIGLYLVKQQVEKNNGSIEVHSTPDKGTTFIIHLPIHSKS